MRILFLLLCLFSASHCRAQTHHLSGQIRDAASGETLPSASVRDLTSGAGALSNSYGYYSLALAPGEHRLEVRYVGYQRHVLTVWIPQTAQLDISLTPSGNQLQEVTVTGQTRSILPGQIGLTMPYLPWPENPTYSNLFNTCPVFRQQWKVLRDYPFVAVPTIRPW